MPYQEDGSFKFDPNIDLDDPQFLRGGVHSMPGSRRTAAIWGEARPNDYMDFSQYNPAFYNVPTVPKFNPYAPTDQYDPNSNKWDNNQPYKYIRINHGRPVKIPNAAYNPDVPELKDSFIDAISNNPNFKLDDIDMWVANKTGGTGNTVRTSTSGGGQSYIRSGAFNDDGSLHVPDTKMFEEQARIRGELKGTNDLQNSFLQAYKKSKERGYVIPKYNDVQKSINNFMRSNNAEWKSDKAEGYFDSVVKNYANERKSQMNKVHQPKQTNKQKVTQILGGQA